MIVPAIKPATVPLDREVVRALVEAARDWRDHLRSLDLPHGLGTGDDPDWHTQRDLDAALLRAEHDLHRHGPATTWEGPDGLAARLTSADPEVMMRLSELQLRWWDADMEDSALIPALMLAYSEGVRAAGGELVDGPRRTA